jgi:hypothetical protein
MTTNANDLPVKEEKSNHFTIYIEECSDCRGTGIDQSARKIGRIGIVCLTCNGEACIQKRFKPFTGRKHVQDVDVVYRVPGDFIPFYQEGLTGGVTYREFIKGKMPELSEIVSK